MATMSRSRAYGRDVTPTTKSTSFVMAGLVLFYLAISNLSPSRQRYWRRMDLSDLTKRCIWTLGVGLMGRIQ